MLKPPLAPVPLRRLDGPDFKDPQVLAYIEIEPSQRRPGQMANWVDAGEMPIYYST